MNGTGNDPTEPERQDVSSDPSRDDAEGSDWTDEGGATPLGPATDSPAE